MSDFGIVEAEDNSQDAIDKGFFVIEAKRLPTPGKERKKEYVSSNYGGMERYKKGHHGMDLSESAIIGYVQKDDCKHWHQAVNSWIRELIKTNTEKNIEWNDSDLLIETDNLGTVRKYVSTNNRTVEGKKDTLKIHHYLMNLI